MLSQEESGNFFQRAFYLKYWEFYQRRHQEILAGYGPDSKLALRDNFFVNRAETRVLVRFLGILVESLVIIALYRQFL